MKIEHPRGSLGHAALSILILAFSLMAAGCNGSYSGGGGGNTPYITGLSVSSGPVGTSVTITGTNFGATQGSSTVTFNGTAATPTSWSATSIVVPVPNGATTGSVVVTVGGKSSNGMTFTVTSTAPSITSLSPTSGPVGTSVAITGTNFGATQGTSTVKFNGTTATPTGWSATSITTQVPAGATTGNVVVTVGGMPSNGMPFMVTTATSTASWTYVQDSLATGCSANTSSCTIGIGNMLPTIAGTVWVVAVQTTNNVTITSVTGGGGAWTLCPASSCHFFSSTLARNVDMAYNLTGNAGTTQVTFSLSGGSGPLLGANFFEFLPPAGSTASFDTAGGTSSPNCTPTCTGVPLTLSGTDVVLQSMHANNANAWKAWSSPYTTLPLGEGLYLNATSGAAPTVSVSGTGAIVHAIAFKSSLGTFSPPAQPISVVNYTAPQGIICSPSCSLSIPATGSGHLLYLEAGDLTTNRISSVSGGGAWVIPSGSNTCQITLPSVSGALSCGYVLSSTAGVTSLNVTMTGNGSASFAVWEVDTTSGAFAFDVQGSATNSPSYNPKGVALPLTGTDDVIFQSAFVNGGTSAVSLYPMPRVPGQGTMFFNNEAACAALLNTTNGSAPLWADEQGNATVVTGMAFKVQ